MLTTKSVGPRPLGSLPPPAVPSVNVSSPTGVPDDDAYWQRPEPGAGTPGQANGPISGPASGAAHGPANGSVPGHGRDQDQTSRYDGPPRSAPPSPYWRPPTIA